MQTSRFPAYVIALLIALALGGFAVSLTGSRALLTIFAFVYIAFSAAWLTMTFRSRS